LLPTNMADQFRQSEITDAFEVNLHWCHSQLILVDLLQNKALITHVVSAQCGGTSPLNYPELAD
jgi:hypothetical protein